MVTQDSTEPQIFNKGSQVEVSSDEDSFRGAWYLATIIESPPKSASKKLKKSSGSVQHFTLSLDFNELCEGLESA